MNKINETLISFGVMLLLTTVILVFAFINIKPADDETTAAETTVVELTKVEKNEFGI